MSKKITVSAETKNLDAVTEFADAELESAGCSPKMMMQINIAIDEIFSNIANYAYPDSSGEATVEVCVDNAAVKIIFSDSGTPFNLLEAEDPDITTGAEERSIGGLGIFMVKKIMDRVEYEYRDGRNIVSITKNR